MNLSDCKFGDRLYVYLTNDCLTISPTKTKYKITATLVASFTDTGCKCFLLAWDGNDSIRPSSSSSSTMVLHKSNISSPLYSSHYSVATVSDPSKYLYGLWVNPPIECELMNVTTTISSKKDYGDECPCGVHPSVCSYHQ